MRRSFKSPLAVVAAAAGLLVVLYAGACGFLFLRQNYLLYTPKATVRHTPASMGLAYQEVWLPVPNSRDAEQVHGWWIPAVSQEKGVVLYFHGAGNNLEAYRGDLKAIHRLGFSVFAIDYRGYGRSRGRFPSETQIYEDARLAWNYLTQKRQIPARRIYLFGVSLGGAVAIDLAKQQPDAAALIAVGTFTSMREQVAAAGYWMFPIDGLLTQRFDSIQKIRDVRIPVLLAHGTGDRFVPSWMSQQLYEAAAEPKRLLRVPGLDHGQIGTLIKGREFTAEMQRLYQSVDRRQAAPSTQ